MAEPILELEDVSAGYERTRVLEDISLSIEPGSITSIVGRNGAGKTTMLRAIMGLIRVSSGSIRYHGAEITNQTPESICRRGLGYVPENREIFPTLTVEENLRVGGISTDSGWLDIEGVYEYFPHLNERRSNRGGQLSGGEQQMLSIARSLMGDTECLLLDEPTEGLAPKIVEHIVEIVEHLSADGITILIVEQNLPLMLELAEYHYVIADGTMVFDGSSETLEDASEIHDKYLGVAGE